jgi:parallel beta-helix repeat protein
MSRPSRLIASLLIVTVPLFLAGCERSSDPVATEGLPSLEAVRAGAAITSCGAVIERPGTYHLTRDLLACPENGINVRSSYVTLYLDGHTITGTDSGFGLNLGRGVPGGLSHLRIVGPGTVEKFAIGVLNERVTYSTFSRLTCRHNAHGFTLNASFPSRYEFPSAHDSVLNNRFVDNAYHGASLNGAAASVFKDNYSAGNGFGIYNGYGFYLYEAHGVRLVRNEVVDNFQYGIFARSVTFENLIVGNTVLRNRYGDIFSENCGLNTWRENRYGAAWFGCGT